jgi:hypothetical protein
MNCETVSKKTYSPEQLAEDFGSGAETAREGVRALYESICSAARPEALALFRRWEVLFAGVCGCDAAAGRLGRLAEAYGVEGGRRLKAAELLFAVQTYYALFLKLLAAEAASFFRGLPSPLPTLARAGGGELRRETEDLERGGIFRRLSVENFPGGDPFSWYVFEWNGRVEEFVRALAARLRVYDPATLCGDAAGGRDLLKKLYQQLLPKSVRRGLGEYYTPDWLAEHVLDQLGYEGDPGARLLDPACGSGTFLVAAINRVRARYGRDRAASGEGGLCRRILSNVVGFDLNPLAVLAARTNYLIALRGLTPEGGGVEIPVHLRDSVQAARSGAAERFDYVAGNPPWVRWSRLPEAYRQEVWPLWKEFGLFGSKGFMARLATAELDFSMLFLYACAGRYLKDAGRLGFVITLEVFKSKSAGAGFRRFRVGGGPHLSILRVDDMVALNPFDAGNKTSTVVLRKGRETRYPVRYVKWRPEAGWVPDFRALGEALNHASTTEQTAAPSTDDPTSPWQTAGSHARAVFERLRGAGAYRARRGMSSDPYGVYHVEVLRALKGGRVLIRNLHDRGKAEVPRVARRVEAEHLFPAVRGRDLERWGHSINTAVVCPNRSPRREDIVGEAEMRARAPGTYAYLREFKDILLSRATLWAFYGRDTTLARPPAGGRDHYYRAVRKAGRRGSVVQEILVPFYVVRDLGVYTFQTPKVVWGRMAGSIRAAVVGEGEIGEVTRPVLPLDTTAFVAAASAEEAHYLCALLNSRLVNEAVASFSAAGRGFAAPSVVKSLGLVGFDGANEVHAELARLSARCHRLKRAASSGLKTLEGEIDRLALKLWGVRPAEFDAASRED